MKSAQDNQTIVLENVWKKNVSAFSGQVVDIWKQHGGPLAGNAEERLAQLVFVVKNNLDEVVGMSTAFKVYVKQLRNHFFAIRLLLVPEYRVPGLTSRLIVSTRDFLEDIHEQDSVDRAIGVITLVENETLKQKRNEAIWPASKMVYIGNSKAGHHIRVYYFKGAHIAP